MASGKALEGGKATLEQGLVNHLSQLGVEIENVGNVFLSRVIRTPATIGYDRVNNMIVTEANGKKVTNMRSLAEALKEPKDGLHSIRVEDVPYVLYLDPKLTQMVDDTLLQRGLPALERLP